MGRADKKSEKLTTGLEELERELQATREQLKAREREAAAEAAQAWRAERAELVRELDSVKTRFARTQRVERAKFLEFYRVIQELRDENEQLKAQSGGGGGGGGGGEAQRRLADENEKQAKRIREQRDFIEELMQSKAKLMDQVSGEVKRNAALSRENAVLHDTIRQQLSFIENNHNGAGGGASSSPTTASAGVGHDHHQQHMPQSRPAVASPSRAAPEEWPAQPTPTTTEQQSQPIAQEQEQAPEQRQPRPVEQPSTTTTTTVVSSSPQRPAAVFPPLSHDSPASPSMRRDLPGGGSGVAQHQADAKANGVLAYNNIKAEEEAVTAAAVAEERPSVVPASRGGWFSYVTGAKKVESPKKTSAEFVL